ncbi:MAG: NHL repeat-containing protein [Planctomycetota bacterium]
MRTHRLNELLLSGLLALCACGGGGSDAPKGPLNLYVSDVGTDAVAIWRPETGVTGDVAPTSTIGGLVNTDLNRPYGLHHVGGTDTLLVGDLDNDAIKFFDSVSTLNGDVAPTRTLSGAATLISGANGYEVFVDAARDLLYMAVEGGVLVFANASTIDGDVAPVRNITGGNTGFSGSRDIRLYVDSVNDRLYLLDGDIATLSVFDNASTVDGNSAPNRVVTGGNTLFNFPWGIAVDVARDIVYVADESNNEIYIFDNASTIDGDIAPNRVLSGVATLLDSPAGIDLDKVTNRLYSTINGGVLVWADASTVDGDVAPSQAILGAATTLSSPADLVVTR